MQQRRLDLDVSLASWAVILGGLSVVVGSLLPWFRGDFLTARVTAMGFSGWEGKVTLVAGILVLGRGLLLRTREARGIRRAWILLQSLIALAVSTYEMLTYRSQFVNDVVAKASARIATPPVDVRARVS